MLSGNAWALTLCWVLVAESAGRLREAVSLSRLSEPAEPVCVRVSWARPDMPPGTLAVLLVGVPPVAARWALSKPMGLAGLAGLCWSREPCIKHLRISAPNP